MPSGQAGEGATGATALADARALADAGALADAEALADAGALAAVGSTGVALAGAEVEGASPTGRGRSGGLSQPWRSAETSANEIRRCVRPTQDNHAKNS